MVNSLTAEQVALPEGQWELDVQGEQGWLYRSMGQDMDALEVDHFLNKAVFKCGDRMYAVWESGGHMVKQELALQRLQHRGVSIDIGLGECASGAARVDLAEWAVADQGVAYSWRLLSLFAALRFKDGKATTGRWVADGSASWARFLTDALELPPKHSCKSKPTTVRTVQMIPLRRTTVGFYLSRKVESDRRPPKRWAWGSYPTAAQPKLSSSCGRSSSSGGGGGAWQLRLLMDAGAQLAMGAPWQGRCAFVLAATHRRLRADRRHEALAAGGCHDRLALDEVARGALLGPHAC